MTTFHSEKTRLGYTNSELAAALDVSERTVRRLVAGTKEMSPSIALHLKTLKTKPLSSCAS